MKLFSEDFYRCVNQILEKSATDPYVIICKTGASGMWSYTPYCAILSPKYSKTLNGYSPSKGMFPIYLVSIDDKEVYLAYMLGVGSKNERTLRRMTEQIRECFSLPNFSTDTSKMDLGKDIHKYKNATIWYKKYESANPPSEGIIRKDLLEIIQFHEEHGDEIYRIISEINRAPSV